MDVKWPRDWDKPLLILCNAKPSTGIASLTENRWAVTLVVVRASLVLGPNQKLGSIDRIGNRRMRTLLVEAVWRLKTWNPTWRGFKKFPHVFGFEATARGATRNKAVVACTRLLAVDLWQLQTGRATLKDLGLKPGLVK